MPKATVKINSEVEGKKDQRKVVKRIKWGDGNKEDEVD